MKTSVFVSKHIFLITWVWGMLILLPFTVQSQDNSCLQQFERAQIDFKQGKIFKVIKLENCVNKLPLYLKDDAYYLLFKSYVIIGNDSLATKAMQKLLRENPNFDASNEDVKFRYHYQKFESKPKEIGLFIGQNLNTPLLASGRRSTGFSLGITHHHFLLSRLQFFKQLIYSERANFMASPTGPNQIPGVPLGNIYLDEVTALAYGFPPDTYSIHLTGSTHPTYLEGTTGLNWIALSHKRIEFFLSGGIAVNYLFENTFGDGELYSYGTPYSTDDEGNLGGISTNPIAQSIAEAKSTEHNTKINASYLFGAGVRVKVNKGILFMDARFQRSIMKQKVSFTSKTQTFDTILQLFPEQTLNFQTETLTFSAGYLFRVQNFKRLRN